MGNTSKQLVSEVIDLTGDDDEDSDDAVNHGSTTAVSSLTSSTVLHPVSQIKEEPQEQRAGCLATTSVAVENGSAPTVSSDSSTTNKTEGGCNPEGEETHSEGEVGDEDAACDPDLSSTLKHTSAKHFTGAEGDKAETPNDHPNGTVKNTLPKLSASISASSSAEDTVSPSSPGNLVCGTCDACLLEPCGLCRSCKTAPSNHATVTDCCSFKLCPRASYPLRYLVRHRTHANQAVMLHGTQQLRSLYEASYGPSGWVHGRIHTSAGADQDENKASASLGGQNGEPLAASAGSSGEQQEPQARSWQCHAALPSNRSLLRRKAANKTMIFNSPVDRTSVHPVDILADNEKKNKDEEILADDDKKHKDDGIAVVVDLMQDDDKVGPEEEKKEENDELPIHCMPPTPASSTDGDSALGSNSSRTHCQTAEDNLRCGACNGCKQRNCDMCDRCKRLEGTVRSPCSFRPCMNFCNTTLITYRLFATEVTERLRNAQGTSPLDSLYDTFYGPAAWTTKRINDSAPDGKQANDSSPRNTNTSPVPQALCDDTISNISRAHTGLIEKKRKKSGHCRKCDACLRKICGLCHMCRLKGSSCAFKICQSYPYATSTLELYRKFASDSIRDNGGSRGLALAHEELYGQEGWVTRLLENKGEHRLSEQGTEKVLLEEEDVLMRLDDDQVMEERGEKDDDNAMAEEDEEDVASLYCSPVTANQKNKGSGSRPVKSGDGDTIGSTKEALGICKRSPSGRSSRCGVCDGCKQKGCGLCNRCRKQYGFWRGHCYFRPCINLAPATLVAYRATASEATERLRGLDGKSPLDPIYNRFYGENGWATQLIEKDYPGQQHELSCISGTPYDMKSNQRKVGRCRKCDGCVRMNCGICSPCQGKGGNTTCVFKLCYQFPYAPSTLKLYSRSAVVAASDKNVSLLFGAVYEAMYGRQGWVTKQLEDKGIIKETEKNFHDAVCQKKSKIKSSRCGDCDGCRQPSCDRCRNCNGGKSCGFRPCRRFTGRTLVNYRSCASDVTERLRDGDGKSPLDALYSRVYGENGWVTQRIEDDTPEKQGGEIASLAKSSANTMASQAQSKKGKQFRCGTCAGCSRGRCGQCRPCQGRSLGNTACAFNLCSEFPYSSSTLNIYRTHAAAAIRENKDSQLLVSLYTELYGEQNDDATVSVPKASSLTATGPTEAKNSRRCRCGRCAGCLRKRCGLCTPCQGRSHGNASCVFNLCSEFPYSSSTLNAYRTHANAAIRENRDSQLLVSLYKELYGEQNDDATVSVAKASSLTATGPAEAKNSRRCRCGRCAGCLRKRCGLCPPCQGRSLGNTSCAFNLCSEFSYSSSTLNIYRTHAAAAIRENKDSQLLVSLYKELYGEQNDDATFSFPDASSLSTSSKTEAKKSRPRRCGTCAGCSRKRCGLCPLCQGQSQAHTSCVFSLCSEFPYASSTLRSYRTYANAAVRDNGDSQLLRSLYEECYGEQGWATHLRDEKTAESATRDGEIPVSAGVRVYARWPVNEMWYWGKILSARRECGKELYGILFDDGDKRENVPGNDFLTLAEYEESQKPRKRKRQGETAGKHASQPDNRVDAIALEPPCTSRDNLTVGSRCYVKYENGWWYWGHVTKVTGSGKTRTFSVTFDDGDSLDGVPTYSLVSEEEYIQETGHAVRRAPSKHDRKRCKIGQETVCSLIPSDLRKARCKVCVMCLKKDCGSCASCRTNLRQTNISKECCLLKMCARISVEEKQQPLSGVLYGFNYYIEDLDTLETYLKTSEPAHPDLQGLVVVDASGKKHRTIASAAMQAGYSSDDDALCEAAWEFYEHTLGVRMTVDVEHELLRKGYYRKWRDFRGVQKEVYGRITKCRKSVIDGSLLFKVSFDADSCGQLKPFAFLDKKVPIENDQILEADAWGGYLLFAAKAGLEVENGVPFHRRYIVPTTRYEHRYSANDIPVVILFIKGFKLELEARASGIPNAGLGLWMTCTPLSPMSKRKYFELKNGEVVDIGVYAPLQAQDCKNDHISLLKNFIYGWDCESWSYETASSGCSSGSAVFSCIADSLFDITDDHTGELHDLAKTNIVVYANETDGRETPSIWASHDPEGAVHYYLGHAFENQRPFRIKADGESMELKIDYGPRYEKVRIQKGYSRLDAGELDARCSTVAQDDTDVIRDLKESSVREILESVEFLEPIFESLKPAKEKEIRSVERALIACLVLQQRLKEICNKFAWLEDNDDDVSICDNGYSTMKQDGTATRLGKLISRLCGLFPHGNNEMCANLRSQDLYRSVLANSLGLENSIELDQFSPRELRQRMEGLLDEILE